MSRFLVLLVVLALVLGLAAARSEPRKNKGRNKEGGRREGKGNSDTTWIWSECVPNEGSCGSGQKTGNCTGDLCEVPTKTADCRVKCSSQDTVEPETPVEGDGEEAVATPARGKGGKGGKGGRRPGKGGNGKTEETQETQENNNRTTGNGRREKPTRGGRKPNKGDKPAKTKECNYARATDSECDPITNRLNKTRVLKGTPTPDCPEVRVESVSCDRNAVKKENRHCKYNWEQAETCNQTSNTFTITGSLVNTEGAPADCEVVRTHEHMCKRGKVPCSFGEWGEFGECNKGLQTRTREVQKGPRNMCHRLTREMAPCE